MTYLSPHVHRIICEIPEEIHNDLLESTFKPTISMSSTTERTKFLEEENTEKRTFYLNCAWKVWKSALTWGWNGDRGENILNSISKFIKWTENAELILECLNQPPEFTNLSILKLTVVIERALGDVFVTIKNEKCPSLLKDLLQTEDFKTLFGEQLITTLHTLMGPPVSLNLRNVLWHGFPMLGEIQSQYCWILANQILCIGKVLEEKQVTNIENRPKLTIPNSDLIRDCFPFINDKEMVLKLFKSTAFIPLGMLPAWKLAIELFFSKRYADAVILFLPQLEHALRCLFTIVNSCPNRQITAESDAFYTTYDEILAKYIGSNTPNRLLPEIGTNMCEMMYDLLYFPEGLRLRDRLSHGEYDFAHVNEIIANHVICIGICFCLKYVFPWKQHLKKDSKLVAQLNNSMEVYASVYHPVAFLLRETRFALDSTEAVLGAAAKMETSGTAESNKIDKIMANFKDILVRLSSLSYAVTEIGKEGHDGIGHAKVSKIIRKLIMVQRKVMHRPKYEIEIIGILRKIVKQTHIASDQVLRSVNEKRIQFDNRALRSRARNNFMTLLSVLPVMTSFWLTLLLIASLEGLMLDNDQNCHVVKHLKKYLKYSENITTLCNSSNNKWLECLTVAENVSEILKEKFVETQILI